MGTPFQMAGQEYESYGNTKRLFLHSISHPSESKFHNFLVSFNGIGPGFPKWTQLDEKAMISFPTRRASDLEILIWGIPFKWPGGTMSHMETQNVCVCLALATHLNQNFTIFWFHSME